MTQTRRYEYRVVWKRQGMKRKTRRYAHLKSAQRFVMLLGPEPWKALNVDPDSPHCRSPEECTCQGGTWRDYLERGREGYGPDGMPHIEYVHIERRLTFEWDSLPELAEAS